MKKILVIQTAFIGDIIMSTPIFKAIKSIYPDAKIYALTTKAGEELLSTNSNIHKIYVFNKNKNKFKKIFSAFDVVSKLKAQNIDLAISIHRSMTSDLIMLLAGIPIRIGNQHLRFVTHKVQIPPNLHNKDRTLALLQPLSDAIFNSETELFVDKQYDEEIKQELELSNKFKLGISPGSIRFTKMWHKEYFAKLINMMISKNIDIFIFGSKSERQLCEEIIELSGNNEAHNLAGALSLLESAAYIKNMDLMLTNDSAPLHIANAVGTDVFAIFGPTVKKFGCYPYRSNDKIIEIDELECRPCGKHGGKSCPLKHHKCMSDITPEYVFKLINDRIRESSNG